MNNLRLKSVSKLNNSLMKFLKNTFKNKMIFNTLFVLLSLSAVLIIPRLTKEHLKMFDNMYLRLSLMVLISLLALVEPVLSLLLAINFVVAVQRLHDLKKQSLLKVNNKDNLVEDTEDEETLEEGVEGLESVEGIESVEGLESVEGVEEKENKCDDTKCTGTDLNICKCGKGGSCDCGLQNNNETLVGLSDVSNNLPLDSVNYNISPSCHNNKVVYNGSNGDDDEQNKIVIGELLQDGYDDYLNNDNVLKNTLSIENSAGNINNVLTAEIENVEDVFTTKNQLLDIQTNLVNCKENKDFEKTQGMNDNSPKGFLW